MANKDKKLIQSLTDSLILITGGQFLIGFAYRTFLEKGFEKLDSFSQFLMVLALSFLLVSLGLLISTGTFHCIVDQEFDRDDLREYVTKICSLALFPMAISLGLVVYVVISRIAGKILGIFGGLLITLMGLVFWYGIEVTRKLYKEGARVEDEAKEAKQPDSDSREETTNLPELIDHLLTEIRLVLPGVQALLGFQFTAMLTEGFDSLPLSSKYVHIGCLLILALTNILLISPAAYHRIVEDGEDTFELHRYGSRLFQAALIFLAAGISGDFFIVIRKVSGSVQFALVLAGLMLIFFYGLWFGYTYYQLFKTRRAHHKPAVN